MINNAIKTIVTALIAVTAMPCIVLSTCYAADAQETTISTKTSNTAKNTLYMAADGNVYDGTGKLVATGDTVKVKYWYDLRVEEAAEQTERENAAHLSSDNEIAAEQQKIADIALSYYQAQSITYCLGSKAIGHAGDCYSDGTLDCSGYVQMCYWQAGLTFDSANTYQYNDSSDLVEINGSNLQLGDMWVVSVEDNRGLSCGHVMMYVGQATSGGAKWVECASKTDGVTMNQNLSFMCSHNSHYYRYAAFADCAN